MKIVIAGGGTAGWITLVYIVAKLDADVTIIHSDEIPIIGVGESTAPTIKQIADAVGVEEHVWMKDSKATFKYGGEFYNFKSEGSKWFHSFDAEIPHQAFDQPIVDFGKETFEQELTSLDYFLKLRQQDPSYDIDKFNKFHGPLQHLLDSEIGHYNISGKDNIGRFPGYAYHVNAYEYSQCLRKHTSKDKFTEIVDTIDDVELDDSGVKSLLLKSGKRVYGDLFIDCTGFRRMLISKLTDYVKFDGLLNDRAVAGCVKGLQFNSAATQNHAQSEGWIWAIPTWGQVGSGYVHCSDFISEDEACHKVERFWKDRGHVWKHAKTIKFEGGRSRHLSIKNVVANGLSQSFIEPLEATSIMITSWTVIRLVEVIQRYNNDWNEKSSRLLNSIMTKFMDNTKQFVKYHYQLSDRTEDYWMQYKNENAVSEVNDVISNSLTGPWPLRGETLINKFNWISMLIGYDKPFDNKLRNITDEQLENYLHFSKISQENYKFITRNNLSNEEILRKIHS